MLLQSKDPDDDVEDGLFASQEVGEEETCPPADHDHDDTGCWWGQGTDQGEESSTALVPAPHMTPPEYWLVSCSSDVSGHEIFVSTTVDPELMQFHWDKVNTVIIMKFFI